MVAVPEGAAGSPPFKEPKGNPVKAVVKTTVDREVENRKIVQTYQKMYRVHLKSLFRSIIDGDDFGHRTLTTA